MTMPKIRRMTAAVLAVMAASAALADAARADDKPLADFEVVYAVSWSGLPVGDARVSLKADGTGNCYTYSTTTKPVGFVKALYGSPNQSSHFCVKDGRVRAQHFDSVLEGDEKQSYTLDFDYAKHAVTDENGATREITDEAVDSFSLQQAVRLWAAAHAKDEHPPIGAFTMVDRKNFTYYQFRFAGRESVSTPAGDFDAIKIERIDNPDKTGLFWVAPARDYLPVKIETRSGGKPPVLLTLKR